jgi:hypothetical protein
MLVSCPHFELPDTSGSAFGSAAALFMFLVRFCLFLLVIIYLFLLLVCDPFVAPVVI